jgi:uncharacterized membrane protein
LFFLVRSRVHSGLGVWLFEAWAELAISLLAPISGQALVIVVKLSDLALELS